MGRQWKHCQTFTADGDCSHEIKRRLLLGRKVMTMEKEMATQYSCPENSTDRGIWWATVHGVHKGQTRLSDWGQARCCCGSAAQSCSHLCDCSTPGLPVGHRLPEPAQTHVHRVRDAIQPSRPLSPPLLQYERERRLIEKPVITFSNSESYYSHLGIFWKIQMPRYFFLKSPDLILMSSHV